jgi:hypothetical protein
MDLTMRLRGKTVAEVRTNGHALSIRAHDGTFLDVAWVDDNGNPIMGKPVVQAHGVRLQAAGLQDLIHLPHAIRAR